MPDRILVVCTANQCRSPMGEALLRKRLAKAQADAVVRSCGRLGDGRPFDPYAIAAMTELGLDISTKRSHNLQATVLGQADLVITMELAHIRDIAGVEFNAWQRSFPLPDLARRALVVGERADGETLRDWVARVHASRSSKDMLSTDTKDDVDDPLGGSLEKFRSTARTIDSYLAQIVSLAYP